MQEKQSMSMPSKAPCEPLNYSVTYSSVRKLARADPGPGASHESTSEVLQNSGAWKFIAAPDCLQSGAGETHSGAGDHLGGLLSLSNGLDRRPHRERGCGRRSSPFERDSR